MYSIETDEYIAANWQNLEFRKEILEEIFENFVHKLAEFIFEYFIFENQDSNLKLIGFLLHIARRTKKLLKKEINSTQVLYEVDIGSEIEQESTYYFY